MKYWQVIHQVHPEKKGKKKKENQNKEDNNHHHKTEYKCVISCAYNSNKLFILRLIIYDYDYYFE